MTGLRSDIEDFLYAEAALLDDWRLDDWLALFSEDGVYQVPTAGAPDDADPSDVLFYIADDHQRLVERVIRLKDPDAHAEHPRSQVRRIYGNVRVAEEAGEVIARCTFMAKRAKNRRVDDFFGHIIFRLIRDGVSWKIRAKRVHLDMDVLHPGKVSIIL
jgi:p-cumate 2,3-dioxygenase subunit beta